MGRQSFAFAQCAQCHPDGGLGAGADGVVLLHKRRALNIEGAPRQMHVEFIRGQKKMRTILRWPQDGGAHRADGDRAQGDKPQVVGLIGFIDGEQHVFVRVPAFAEHVHARTVAVHLGKQPSMVGVVFRGIVRVLYVLLKDH